MFVYIYVCVCVRERETERERERERKRERERGEGDKWNLNFQRCKIRKKNGQSADARVEWEKERFQWEQYSLKGL